jgi:3-hydroxyisobutyrate dehydrogenase-like beta-hydroxyacid dehydrogenase
MRVGILGSGLMGGKLGTLLARASHEVVFSYARRHEKLKELALDVRGYARAGTPREAAQSTDALQASRALVPNRRCAESDRRFVGQGDRHLLPPMSAV